MPVVHAAEETKRTFGEYTDDTMLLGKVKSALGSDKTTEAGEINVEVNKGIVQLNGFVDTAKEKAQAETVAKGVKGVKQVENNLIVKTAGASAGQSIDDSGITSKVNTALVRSDQTKAGDIKVQTRAASSSSPASSTARAQSDAGKVAQIGRGREVREEQPSRESLRQRRRGLYAEGARSAPLKADCTALRKGERPLCPSAQSPTFTTRKSTSASSSAVVRGFSSFRIADRPDPHAMPGVVVDRDPLHVRLDALQGELRAHAVGVLELLV